MEDNKTKFRNYMSNAIGKNWRGSGESKFLLLEGIYDFFEKQIADSTQAATKRERQRIASNVGSLRQWLNEKPKDMLVTNDHIIGWLALEPTTEEK